MFPMPILARGSAFFLSTCLLQFGIDAVGRDWDRPPFSLAFGRGVFDAISRVVCANSILKVKG